jgi:hypothetical protein
MLAINGKYKDMWAKDVSYFAIYIFILAASLGYYYSGGTIILGGEGAFLLDFSDHIDRYKYAWQPTGVGSRNIIIPGVGFNSFLLSFIGRATESITIVSFSLIFAIYLAPFTSMYMLSRAYRATPFVSFLVSYFYIVNPFTLTYLYSLNQWSVFSIAVMPLFLWILLKNYNNNLKLFSIFGIVAALFSFSFSNLPTLIIIIISILLSICLACYHHHEQIHIGQVSRKFLIVLSSFVLCNTWWIINLYFSMDDVQGVYTESFAKDWLDEVVRNSKSTFAKAFSLTQVLNLPSTFDFFMYFYGSSIARIVAPIILILMLSIAFILNGRSRIISILFAGLLASLFLIKGSAAPFGLIYNFLFKEIPFFYIFKTPLEKFSLLYIFIFSILLLLLMKDIDHNKYYKSIIWTLGAYLIFCSIPIFTGNIIPDYKVGIDNDSYVTKKYKDKSEHKELRQAFLEEKKVYRVLSLPGGNNYQVLMHNYDNKYYSGLDPILMNIDKAFISPPQNVPFIYERIGSSEYGYLLGIFNIGKILINEDLIPWFGVAEDKKLVDLHKIFRDKMKMPVAEYGRISVYDNKNNYVPIVHAGQQSMLIK